VDDNEHRRSSARRPIAPSQSFRITPRLHTHINLLEHRDFRDKGKPSKIEKATEVAAEIAQGGMMSADAIGAVADTVTTVLDVATAGSSGGMSVAGMLQILWSKGKRKFDGAHLAAWGLQAASHLLDLGLFGQIMGYAGSGLQIAIGEERIRTDGLRGKNKRQLALGALDVGIGSAWAMQTTFSDEISFWTFIGLNVARIITSKLLKEPEAEAEAIEFVQKATNHPYFRSIHLPSQNRIQRVDPPVIEMPRQLVRLPKTRSSCHRHRFCSFRPPKPWCCRAIPSFKSRNLASSKSRALQSSHG
jgi:hypothetical protein